ncbi:TatD family hydrolase [Candidatus Bipolaricaulota bacterium]|nr:TatD family hydrolase [Candidatus Bipolaricaulota bacterium]
MKWIDSHAHLDDRAFDKDRAAMIARCSEQAMGVLTIGSSLRSSHEAVRLANRYRNMWATVGIHPHNAKFVDEAALIELRELAGDELVVGIGEIGLDYYRDLSPRERQRQAFVQQLALAIELNLPICLHNRESTDDLLAILKNAGEQHYGVVHSFLGEGVLAEEFLALGLHLGIGGPLTFPKNDVLREAVKHIPLDRILLETDCPYLTPVPYRGRRNEPAYVRYVAEEIARLKGVSVEDVARQTTENSIRLFRLSD